MTEHDCTRHAHLHQRRVEEFCLGIGSPPRSAWAAAVPETGAVKGDDAVPFGRKVNKAAGVKILDHAAVSMQKDEDRTFAPFHVMQTNAIDVEKLSGGRVQPFCLCGKLAVGKGRRRQNGTECGKPRQNRMPLEPVGPIGPRFSEGPSDVQVGLA